MTIDEHKAIILNGLTDIGEGRTVSSNEFWNSLKGA
jgi:hypothetical protein